MTTEPVESRPRWPAWYGPAGFLFGLLGTLTAFAVAGVVVAAAGGHLPTDGPGVQIVGTLVQDGFFVAAAVVLAARVARPRLWQFGIRSAPLGRAARETGKALLAFYLFAGAYALLLHPHGQQSVAKDLGANNGGVDMVLGAILVIAIAPAAEEFFFRGFFYTALRTRFRMIPAALIDGVVFGAIHYTDPKTLSILPILMALGFLLCLLYERTGSLLTCIALHSLNNAIAWSSTVHDSGALAAGLAVFVIGTCALLLRTIGPRARVAT